MQVNKFVTMTVGLVVGVLLISGVVAPVISDVSSDDGGTGNAEKHTNPDTWLRYSYATSPTDFSISYTEDAVFEEQKMILSVESNGMMTHEISFSIDPLNVFGEALNILYADESRIIAFMEGGVYLDCADGSIAMFGATGTIICSEGQITVTDGQDVSNTTTFPASSQYFYADANGNYGKYINSQIQEGLYTSTAPLYSMLMLMESNTIIYNEYCVTVSSTPVSSEIKRIVDTTDGKLDAVYYYYNDDRVDAQTFILPLEVGGNSDGSGISPTLTTILSVIPLVLTVGLVLGAVTYLRMKN